MPKFENRFVHFTWDESLKGKECFVADNIPDLNDNFNDGNRETVIDCFNRVFPFKINGDCFRFAYCDPNYDVKVAYEEGKQIQYKAKDTGRWCDWEDSLSKCTFVDNVEYRVKPEESKLKWTDLSIGDIIERIGGPTRKAMVTEIDKSSEENDMHVYAGCVWFTDEQLKNWRKV